MAKSIEARPGQCVFAIRTERLADRLTCLWSRSLGQRSAHFTKDTANSGKSVCSGPCLTAWPAVVASSDTPTGEGITAKLGTITRDDGTKQVTVAGLPVYLWQKDKAPGDVTGQGVGKVWYVVAPDGKMITTAPKG